MIASHRTAIRAERVRLSARILSGSALTLSLVLSACGGGGGGGNTTPTAVTNQWTWEGGSSTGNVQGSYGTLSVAASGNIPGARDHAVSWTDANGNVWLFGGNGYDSAGTQGDLNDLWKFNPTSKEWTWVAGPDTSSTASLSGATGIYGSLGTAASGNIPGAREDAVTGTDASGNLWLFGGYGYDSAGTSGDLNDLWKFDPVAQEWTWEGGSSAVNAKGTYSATHGTAGPNYIPGARADAVTWTDASGNVWLFGGYGYDSAGTLGNLNDLWEFNPALKEWTWVAGPNTSSTASLSGATGIYGSLGTAASGNIPGARGFAAAWTDTSGNLWLFGGYGYDSAGKLGRLNDLWKFDPVAQEWTWEGGSSTISAPGNYGTLGTAASGNIPGARNSALAWADASGNLWLFGGVGVSSDFNDLWKFDPVAQEWTWEGGSTTGNASGNYGTLGTAASGNNPGSRDSAIAWTDARGNFWLFGGAGFADNAFNDLWKYQP